MSRLVRAACLTNYVEIARSGGLDPYRLLSEAGLPRAAVEDSQLRISAESACRLLERSAALSGQGAFGLLMAEGRRISNFGLLGLLMREEPNLRLALQSMASYGPIHNEAIVHRIEESDGVAIIQEELLTGSSGSVRQATEMGLAMVMRLLRFFLGSHWKARHICFVHTAPADLSVHRRVLGQTPEFNHDFNGIVCTSADLDTPIASADPVMATYIRQQLQRDTDASLRITNEVRKMALILMPQGRCTVDEVSRLMGITRRTLHRQLSDEESTFSDLLFAIRHELASRYVDDKRRSLTEVSQLLGFADLSSFSRWHKAAFGLSAAAVRSAGKRKVQAT